MSKVKEYFRIHRPSWYVRLCEDLVKALSALLVAAGFLVIGYAIFVLVAWSVIRPPGGSSHDRHHLHLLENDHPRTAELSLPALQLTRKHEQPWLLYASIGAGAGTVLASFTGFLGASLRSLTALNLFIFLQCVQLTYQTCLSIVSFKHADWYVCCTPTTWLW